MACGNMYLDTITCFKRRDVILVGDFSKKSAIFYGRGTKYSDERDSCLPTVVRGILWSKANYWLRRCRGGPVSRPMGRLAPRMFMVYFKAHLPMVGIFNPQCRCLTMMTCNESHIPTSPDHHNATTHSATDLDGSSTAVPPYYLSRNVR
jgi:hypothetical protein